MSVRESALLGNETTVTNNRFKNKKMKQLSFLRSWLLLLTMLFCTTVASAEVATITFSKQGYSNEQEITDIKVDENVTLTFNKGSNNYAPKYYNSGYAIRLYGGNTLKFEVKGQYKLTDVDFTVASGNKISDASTVTAGHLSNLGTTAPSWNEDNADSSSPANPITSFTLTQGGTSGHARIQSIKITYVSTAPAGDEKTISVVESVNFPVSYENLTTPESQTLNVTGYNLTENITYSNTGDFTVTEADGWNNLSGGSLNIACTATTAGTHEGVLTITSGDVTKEVALSATISEVAGTGTGTEADPYDVTRAKAVIDILTSKSDVCVKGEVSKVDSYNLTYKSITYWLDNSSFEVYSGKNLDNTDFSSKDDIQIGDYVIVRGEIKKYNSTYELNSGNYLVKHLKKPQFSIGDVVITKGEEIVPTITTTNTDSYEVTYTSSSENVTVSGDGKTLTAAKVGEATITATIAETANFLEATTTFNVTVTTDATLEIIVISGDLTKKEYTYGEEFDYSGLTVTAMLSDDSEVDVTTSTTWSNTLGETLTTLGANQAVTITATYEGETDTEDVTITVKDVLESIALSGTYKTEYLVNDEFDATGLVVTAHYLSGDEQDATNNVTFSGYDMSQSGEQTVTVSFEDLDKTVTATYTINITDPNKKSIEISSGGDWNGLFGTNKNGSFSVNQNSLELKGTKEGVSINVVNGTSTNAYIKTNDFRVYNGYKLTISAPKGFKLCGIITEKGDKTFPENTVTSDKGTTTLSSGNVTWTGSTDKVVLTIAGTGSFKTMTVDITRDYDYEEVIVSAAGAASYSSRKALDFTDAEDVEAFVAKSTNGEIVTMEKVTGTVAAETGLMIKASEGTYYIPVVATGEDKTDNLLKPWWIGETVAVSTAKVSNYIFGYLNGSEGAGFIRLTGEVAKSNETTKNLAYLHVEVVEPQSQLIIKWNVDLTGVEDLTVAPESGDDAMYNVMGQKVGTDYKGIVIKNGKKYINK